MFFIDNLRSISEICHKLFSADMFPLIPLNCDHNNTFNILYQHWQMRQLNFNIWMYCNIVWEMTHIATIINKLHYNYSKGISFDNKISNLYNYVSWNKLYTVLVLNINFTHNIEDNCLFRWHHLFFFKKGETTREILTFGAQKKKNELNISKKKKMLTLYFC